MRRHTFTTATLKKDAENVVKKRKETAKASGSKAVTTTGKGGKPHA